MLLLLFLLTMDTSCRQYNEMARDRPTARTIEELAADLRQVGNQNVVSTSPPNDLPPKYEDLVDSAASASEAAPPPAYEEVNEGAVGGVQGAVGLAQSEQQRQPLAQQESRANE